jgi:hypothetical protein
LAAVKLIGSQDACKVGIIGRCRTAKSNEALRMPPEPLGSRSAFGSVAVIDLVGFASTGALVSTAEWLSPDVPILIIFTT